MNQELNLSENAINAIISLQHKCGTYKFYSNTLKRIQYYILHQSEEIGMSARETLSTLRALSMLQEDLSEISGFCNHNDSILSEPEDDQEEITDRVNALFSEPNEKQLDNELLAEN